MLLLLIWKRRSLHCHDPTITAKSRRRRRLRGSVRDAEPQEWAHLDSNQGLPGYEPGALTAELWAPMEERATGFEPATACLEGRGSTTELHPRKRSRNSQKLLLRTCRGERTRTSDPSVPNAVRYQLRYAP